MSRPPLNGRRAWRAVTCPDCGGRDTACTSCDGKGRVFVSVAGVGPPDSIKGKLQKVETKD